MINGIIAFLLWRLDLRMIAREPRRQRIAVVFWAMVWFAFFALLELIAYVAPLLLLAFVPVLLLLPFSVLILVGLLIGNGIKNIRKEGRSLGNSLALLTGLALLALPVAGVAVIQLGHPIATGLALLMFLASSQVGLSFLVFYTFYRLYARFTPRPDPDAVVVLGSGLVGGKVPPLLRARLDRGLTAFNEVRASGRDCLLVPSGGRGPDEPVAEAEAMAEYLLSQGVDPRVLVPETKSRNTEQNLIFSAALVDRVRRGEPVELDDTGHHADPLEAREAEDSITETPTEVMAAEDPAALDDTGHRSGSVVTPDGEGSPSETSTEVMASEPSLSTGSRTPHGATAANPHLLVVTNGYHVPRAALWSRRLGVDADVIGAPTARYFVPSAFLREFVGVVVMNKRLHVVWALLSVVTSVLIAWLLWR